MDVRVGHSPDPDDAFMYWALTTDLVDTRGFRFEQVLADIQTLNEWALEKRLEVTAISLATYPFVQDDYALLPHGASIGTGYGPIARRPRAARPRRPGAASEIVVPGAMTTAFLTLRLVLGDFAYRELPFEQHPGGGRERPGRRRAADPRGPAHVRRHRAAQGRRPRRVVAPRDRSAAAPRRQRRAARHRAARRSLRRARARRSAAGSSTVTRRSSTPSSSAAASTRRSPTGSSRCT